MAYLIMSMVKPHVIYNHNNHKYDNYLPSREMSFVFYIRIYGSLLQLPSQTKHLLPQTFNLLVQIKLVAL